MTHIERRRRRRRADKDDVCGARAGRRALRLLLLVLSLVLWLVLFRALCLQNAGKVADFVNVRYATHVTQTGGVFARPLAARCGVPLCEGCSLAAAVCTLSLGAGKRRLLYVFIAKNL